MNMAKHLEEMITEIGHDSAVLIAHAVLDGSSNPEGKDLLAAADLLSRVYEVEACVILGKLDTVERDLTSNYKFLANVENGTESMIHHWGF